MRFFAIPVIAALASLNSAYAVIISNEKGCIVYTDVNNVLQSLCSGHTGQIPDIAIEVKACVDPNTGTSACSLFLPEVNMNPQVYWGADDCLYNAGSATTRITCAIPTNPPEQLPFNPYELPVISSGFRFARNKGRKA